MGKLGELGELGDIYVDALTEVISTVSGIHLNVGNRKSDYDFDEITGVMYLHGEKDGMLFVSANEDDVKILCSRMIGVPVKDVSREELADTMCELVNMTAGNAKLRLCDTEFMFSLLQPFVISGKKVSIVTKSVTKVEAGVLTGGDISVRFKVVY